MAARSIPLSVRISEKDAAFIADLKLSDAVTPSDKVRAIIREARQTRERQRDYGGCLEAGESLLRGATNRIKASELDRKIHSALVKEVMTWVPETMAFAASLGGDRVNNEIDLEAIESGLAERVFRLFDTVMRLGVTQDVRCYDPKVVQQHMPPILELAKIIEATQGEVSNDD